jgi:hypothetical protein
MKYIKLTLGIVLTVSIASLLVVYLYVIKEEKMYVCTGVEVHYYPNTNYSRPMDETKKIIPFTYNLTKSLIGRTDVVTVDSTTFINGIGLSDAIINGWYDTNYQHVFFNFDRITKIINLTVSVPDKDRPGYLTYDKVFEGSCVLTTKG